MHLNIMCNPLTRKPETLDSTCYLNIVPSFTQTLLNTSDGYMPVHTRILHRF